MSSSNTASRSASSRAASACSADSGKSSNAGQPGSRRDTDVDAVDDHVAQFASMRTSQSSTPDSRAPWIAAPRRSTPLSPDVTHGRTVEADAVQTGLARVDALESGSPQVAIDELGNGDS